MRLSVRPEVVEGLHHFQAAVGVGAPGVARRNRIVAAQLADGVGAGEKMGPGLFQAGLGGADIGGGCGEGETAVGFDQRQDVRRPGLGRVILRRSGTGGCRQQDAGQQHGFARRAQVSKKRSVH